MSKLLLSSPLVLLLLISDWLSTERGRGVLAQNLEKSRSVWVEQGLLRGKIYKMADKYMQIFRGIPYAEPPIGKLRFKKPVKRSRWHQEYSALDYGAPCMQFMSFHKSDKFSGENMKNDSEDCLFLNVFSPFEPEDESKLFPVLVWIHGGSFLAGSSDTGIDMEVIAKNIIFNDVVLVTINYRLGPLGFLSYTVNGKVAGNFGIWDQVMALQWIQVNIKQLGGDPNQVTLIGESAGAAAASVLAVSPATKDLVHQLIALSGSSTAGWAINRFGQPNWSAQNLAAYLKCDKQFQMRMSEAMRITAVTNQCNLEGRVPDCLVLGISKMIVDEDLIPYSGPELITNLARVPLMIGIAQNEWAHKRAVEYDLKQFDEISKEESVKLVRGIIDEQFHPGCANKLHNSTLELISNATYLRYLDSPEGNRSLSHIIFGLQDLEADVEFAAPAQREIDGYVANDLPVYAFSFNYFPKSPIFEQQRKVFSIFGKQEIKVTRQELQMSRDGRPRAFHGLDHAFLFTNGYTSNLQVEPFTKRDRLFAKMFSTFIANFVKNGNPTPVDWHGFKWPSFQNQSSKYAVLDLPPTIATGSLHWPMANFWNKEVALLEKFAVKEKGVASLREELSTEERLQLSAYRRAWWALWLLVAMIALVIWISVICIVVTRCRSPRAKPYNNIIVGR